MSLAYQVLWGLLATVAMTAVLQASQGFGWSRLSLPLLVGTFLTGQRDRAVVWGYLLYVIGGWLFAFLYFLLFDSIGLRTWWVGALAGLVHGIAHGIELPQMVSPAWYAVGFVAATSALHATGYGLARWTPIGGAMLIRTVGLVSAGAGALLLA